MINSKILSRFSLIFTLAITSTLTINKTALAEGTRFFCANNEKGQPTTFANTPRGDIAMINWHTELGGEYTPQRRCEIVSAKFQNFYDRGILQFLTTGYIRGKSGGSINFICPAITNGGGCACAKTNGSTCEEYEILYTLKPEDEPNNKLQQLMDLRLSSSGPISETNGRIYIDMNQYLRDAVTVGVFSIPAPLNNNNSPTNQTPEVTPSSGNNQDLFFNPNPIK